jgi:RNA polymerase sigma-70 factor, ECF subfamily
MAGSRARSALKRGGLASASQMYSRSPSMPPSTGPRGGGQSAVSPLGRRRQCDDDALDYLYRHHAAGVFAYVRGILRNEHDAEDVTQQVFVKLATSLGRYDARRAPFSAWLLRMAHNAAVDHLRKQRFTLPIDPVETADEREQPGLDHMRSLREAFGALSRAQRDVLLLREVVGLTPWEVAQVLGKSKAAVNTCHHRARRAAVRSLIAMDSTPATRSARAQHAA